jgi:leader peptidase (prepilin peptidase)/N-methyltransferase
VDGLGGRAAAARRIRIDLMENALVVFLVLSSPFVGSFLGLVATRRGTGRTVVFGRSRCPSCGAALGVRDLVPVLSWLALRGRCRRCGARIGTLYPAMELGALAVALSAVLLAPFPVSVVGTALGWTLLLLAAVDAREMLLPDRLTLPLVAAGLALTAFGLGDFADHAIGAAIGFSLMAGIGAGFAALTGREGLGLGDAKLFAAAGAWTGWQGLASVLLIAALAGFAQLLLRSAAGRGGMREAIPFGPALALGFWITWLCGPVAIG